MGTHAQQCVYRYELQTRFYSCLLFRFLFIYFLIYCIIKYFLSCRNARALTFSLFVKKYQFNVYLRTPWPLFIISIDRSTVYCCHGLDSIGLDWTFHGRDQKRYTNEILEEYRQDGQAKINDPDYVSPLPPHVYAIADNAYRLMSNPTSENQKRNQSILVRTSLLGSFSIG